MTSTMDVDKFVAICDDMLSDCPPHKQYESYRDGWTDACNEIKWEAERLYGSPLEMLPGPHSSANKRRDNRDDEFGG